MGLTCPLCHALCLFTCLSGVSWPLSVCLFSELNSSFCVSLSDVSWFSCLWTLLWMSEWWNSQISSWRMKRRRRSRRSFWFSVSVHSEHRSLCGDFYPEGVTDSSPYPSHFPLLPLPLLCVSLHVLAIFSSSFGEVLSELRGFYCLRVQTNNKTKILSWTHHWWFYLTETDFKKNQNVPHSKNNNIGIK